MKTTLKSLVTAILNLAVMVVTFLVFAALIEGGMRVARHFSQVPAEERLYNYDPLLGWKTKPDLNAVLVLEGRKIPFITNSKGLRGSEISYSRAPGKKRVLILGDSFAQAVQVHFEELFSEHLKKRLEGELSWSVEVVNAGVAGYSTDQELLLFRSEGARYSQDLTLLMFHDNDIWYNNQDHFLDKPKPRFQESGDSLVLTNVPVPQASGNLQPSDLKQPSPGYFQSVKIWFTTHSYFYRWIREKVHNSPLLFHFSVHLGLSGKNLPDIPDDFRVWKRRRDPDIDEAWRISEKLLLELREEVQKIGSDFVIFYVPSRPAIVREHWTATKIRYGFREPEWNVRQVGQDLKLFCEKNKIPLIDPTEDFSLAAAGSPKSRPRLLYYMMDSHWAPEGHRLAGEEMTNWILAHSFKKNIS